MKRSTLLTLAHETWRSGEKNPEVADVLAASGLFKSGEIYRITGVKIAVPWEGLITSGRLNPATLDMLRIVATCVENGEPDSEFDDIIRFAVGHGTSRTTIERLTGYDARDSGRERPGDERPSL